MKRWPILSLIAAALVGYAIGTVLVELARAIA